MTDYAKKLAAWLHDPAEKALILLRDATGHENGTARALRERLGIDPGAFDKRADHLAAAADRPQWPRPEDKRFNRFEQVNFAREPELIHPLSGARIDLSPLAADIGVTQIKAVSQDHFERLIQEDARKTFLAFWRFGPEAGRWATELGPLWKMLPADTRVPDHAIWSHVDTVAAIHTALAGDANGPDQPALLAMSFGPVQSFIAQARSTSDLWAGSHLLSSLVWEAIRSIVEELGPDAIVFPALRGVPAVDCWLLETGNAPFRALFEEIGAEFLDDPTDTNPLFAASLPNKFMALVPARRARQLAEAAVSAIQAKAGELAGRAAQKAFDAAGVAMTEVTRQQIADQLAGFPEAYWAAATWPIDGETRDLQTAANRLKHALDTIHPELKTHGIFDAKVWPVLTKELKLADFSFWSPNTGVLYPAVYELVERALAAAKATRPFHAFIQTGYRCTLTGEAEWLTHDRSLLDKNRRDRIAAESVWTKLARAKPSWVKEGEHLGAIATLKRLWPIMFAEDLNTVVGEKVNRYVVSTHAMAMSTSIERLAMQLQGDGAVPPLTLEQQAAISLLCAFTQGQEPATLPKRLMSRLNRLDPSTRDALKRLPSLLDADVSPGGDARGNGHIGKLFGEAQPETYYSLIQMDGDHMGGWLAGNEDAYKLAYRDTWHRRVASHTSHLARDFPELTGYLDTKRPSSPGRHAAISQALNDFSTHLARHIIEDCCKGKLLYAGGDDVLALVAVDDLFDAMQLLRLAYGGVAPDENMGLANRLARFAPGSARGERRLLLAEGFGFLRGRNGSSGRLMTLMGHKATASLGAVVAHHTAPLAMVLRQLREAESHAKNEGRDRFCLRVLKRGGGEVSVTSPWWPVPEDGSKLPQTGRSALALMKRLAQELAQTAFSRGAIYKAQLWFEGLSDRAEDAKNDRWRAQISGALTYQFDRQKGNAQTARDVVDFVCDVIRPSHPRTAIENFMVTAEFFAREARAFQLAAGDSRSHPELQQVST